MFEKSQIEMNIYSWLIHMTLKNKLNKHERF